MVKLPSTPDQNFEGVERRTQLLHDFGALLAVWSEFEIGLEVAIQRLTGMSELHTSIVVGSMQFGAKHKVLACLLREKGDTAAISAVKDAVEFARRNILVHSALSTEDDFQTFSFFNRSFKDRYKVTRHNYTDESFHQHFLSFRDLQFVALTSLKVTRADLARYSREARFMT